MKPSLQLKLSQQLAMTPQLQQAIRLLQLSTLELQQEIQQALDSNPLLELADDIEEMSSEISESTYTQSEAFNADEHEQTYHEEQAEHDFDSRDALDQQQLPQELPVDASWDDIYSTNSAPMVSGSHTVDSDVPLYQGETSESLHDYLLWQAQLSRMSDIDHAIAVALIDAVDDAGYLTQSLEEIRVSLGDSSIEIDEIQAVLTRIQHFDPLGVAARDLRECLLVQLKQLPPQTPARKQAQMI
ncbi:MAG: RNA polymerase factor sigma-54, partial [Plesiomonas sp.]